uniref:Mermaid-6 n=1 Tax=Laxus oneistus TaxID=74811 RepID=E7CYB2_9BILA|nr:mermaid-6 [Laxus oneistus]
MNAMLLLPILLSLLQTAAPASSGWLRSPQGTVVKLYRRLLSWSKADEFCKDVDGRLVVDRTADMHLFLIKNVLREKKSRVWVGLRRTAPHSRTWIWSDGTRQNEDDLNTNLWLRDEPNDAAGEEECALFMYGPWEKAWGLNDYLCRGGCRSYQFICEKWIR